MCTPKVISSFAPKIRIIIIKASVTFLLVADYQCAPGKLTVNSLCTLI